MPREMAAKGAAIQAAIMTEKSSSILDNILLLQATSMNLGIETVGGVMTPIIKKNATIPCVKE
jgi:L1 cell adhesion molecule like protein